MKITNDELNTNDEIKAKLSHNIEYLMKTHNVDSKLLANSTGLSVSLINSLKRGESNPTLNNLVILARFFNVGIDDLVDFDEHTSNDNEMEYCTVPVYALNNAICRSEANKLKNIVIQNDSNYASHQIFGVEIPNNSMAPLIDKGSILILCTQLSYTDGDIVLLNINDHLCFRKVILSGDDIQFISINMQGAPHQYDQYRIEGVVIQIVQKLHS